MSGGPVAALASMMLDAMHVSAPYGTVPSSNTLGATRWSMVLMGASAAAWTSPSRERDEGYDSSRGDEVPPLPGTEGTEIACETTLPLRDDSSRLGADSSRSVGVPSAVPSRDGATTTTSGRW